VKNFHGFAIFFNIIYAHSVGKTDLIKTIELTSITAYGLHNKTKGGMLAKFCSPDMQRFAIIQIKKQNKA
jgi:hypothetical protein